MNYTHLTRNERYQIYILSETGHKQNEIAELINRHPSTISRELSRNRGGCVQYEPANADACPELFCEVRYELPV